LRNTLADELSVQPRAARTECGCYTERAHFSNFPALLLLFLPHPLSLRGYVENEMINRHISTTENYLAAETITRTAPDDSGVNLAVLKWKLRGRNGFAGRARTSRLRSQRKENDFENRDSHDKLASEFSRGLLSRLRNEPSGLIRR